MGLRLVSSVAWKRRGWRFTNECDKGRDWIQYIWQSTERVQRVGRASAVAKESDVFDIEVLHQSWYSLQPDVESML